MILLQVNDSAAVTVTILILAFLFGVVLPCYIVYRIIKWVIAKGVEQGIRDSKKAQAEEEGC